MEEIAKKTYYIGILLPSGESCVATGVTDIAKFLGVDRRTIYNNLGQQSYYQCVKYILSKTTDFRKMNRKPPKTALNFTDTKRMYESKTSVDSKPVKELVYEPFFD